MGLSWRPNILSPGSTELANTFDGFYISHVPRFQNTKTDSLVAVAATLALPVNTSYHLMVDTHLLFCQKYSLEVTEVHSTSTTSNLETGDSPSSTMSCMA